MRSIKYNKKVYVYTPAWGEQHLKWYSDYVLPSLMNDTNEGALVKDGFEIKYVLYTLDSKENIINNVFKGNDKLLNKVEIIEFNKGVSNETRKIVVQSFLSILKRCIKERAMLYLTCADLVYGNSSLYNCVSASYGKNKCLASSYGRVSLDVLSEITPYPKEGIKNSQLVNLAMKYSHGSLKYANEELDVNCTNEGISFKKLSSSLYSVTHNLPSPVLVFPIQDDYEYFKNVDDFNAIDRGWLGSLIRTNRLKFSGSSDLCFYIELTPHSFDNNILIENKKHCDEISNPEIQNTVANTVVSIWRSTK
jgi:hypothetical protein